MGMRKEKDESWKIAIGIFLFCALAYSSIILYVWDYQLSLDEGVFSIMVKEFSGNPAMVIPSVTGEHPEWKPPLHTWVFSAFYFFLKFLPIPVEAAMRLPSALFGAGSVALVFLVGEKLYNRNVGFFAAAILSLMPLMIFCSVAAMLEALTMFLAIGSVYLYISGKWKWGMALLGLIAFAKWAYAVGPALFLAAYFWKKEEFPKIALSLLAVPAGILAYLALAFLFGNFGHALSAVFTYFFTASSEPRSLQDVWDKVMEGANILQPMLILFVVVLAGAWKDARRNLPVALMAAPAVVAPFFGQFIFWYESPALPALALFFAAMIDGLKIHRDEKVFLVLLLVCTTFTVADRQFYGTTYFTGIDEVSGFMKGKSVLFVEPGALYGNWVDTNKNYLGTDAERLVLEQHNPGFLFYRFGDSRDYGNLQIAFINGRAGVYSPPCRDWLVVHERDRLTDYKYQMEIPDCYKFLWRKGDYAAYAGGG